MCVFVGHVLNKKKWRRKWWVGWRSGGLFLGRVEEPGRCWEEVKDVGTKLRQEKHTKGGYRVDSAKVTASSPL